MHIRITLTRIIGLAILLIGITLLPGCNDIGSSGPTSDANANYPYLTAQPAVSPPTVMDSDTVTYTIYATGPMGLGKVEASLATVAQGSGFFAQASASLTETAPGTWTGTGTIDSGVNPLLIGGAGYYVQVELSVDPDPVGNNDFTGTSYTISTSTTKLTFSYRDIAYNQVATNSSAYFIATVTVQ